MLMIQMWRTLGHSSHGRGRGEVQWADGLEGEAVQSGSKRGNDLCHEQD